jgi:hypothetical protein
MTKTPRKNVVDLPLGSIIGPLEVQIRKIAEKSEAVLFSPHALERMAERGLTDVEVIRALRFGSVSGLPWHEPDIGGRGCKVVFLPRGGRAVGVITVVLEEMELLVKTVEWEDRR